MEAQLPDAHPSLTELRAVGGALQARLAGLRERAVAVPDELWQAAERFQPLLDGVDPEPGEAEELWESALTLPGLLARVERGATTRAERGAEACVEPGAEASAEPEAVPAPRTGAAALGGRVPGPLPVPPVSTARLLVGDGVEHVEPRGT